MPDTSFESRQEQFITMSRFPLARSQIRHLRSGTQRLRSTWPPECDPAAPEQQSVSALVPPGRNKRHGCVRAAHAE